MVGDIAADFSLKDQSGNLFNLYDNLTSKILLIFYPKDNTPVCTKQLFDYEINKNEFHKLDIKLVGINADSEKSHTLFADKCRIYFTLLSDSDKEVCKKYKAIIFLGGIKRKLVLIDKNKRILFEDEVISFKYRTFSQLKRSLENL